MRAHSSVIHAKHTSHVETRNPSTVTIMIIVTQFQHTRKFTIQQQHHALCTVISQHGK